MRIPALRVELRIPLLYATFGGAWILFSDLLLAAMVSEPATLTRMQTYKGWAFVAASALLIYLLLRRELALRNITEGKLDETEERYRQLFEHSMDAILLTTPDGRILSANTAACRMLGRTEDEIRQVGRNGIVDLTDPRLEPALEQRARTGSFHGELTLIKADGTKFEGEISTSIFKTTDDISYSTLIIREITERKKTQDALRRSEERYKLISSLASDYMFHSRLDAKGRLQLDWVAGAFEGITGYSFEEYSARGGWRASLYPEDLEADDRDMEKLRAGKRVISEIRTITKSGGTRWVQVYAHPILDPDSRDLIGIYGAVQEITERKKAEEALRKSEELYRKLTENYPNGTVNIYDRDLRMTFVAGGDMKKYDAKPEEFIGKTFQELAPAETFAIAEPYLRAAFEGEYGHYETPYWGDRYYLVNVAPLREADGTINEILVVTQNLTERRRAEEALRLSRDRLTELSRRLAQARETEARAIGRELHDQFGQMLTVLKVTLDLAAQLPPQESAGKIAQAQELIDDLLNRVSRLSLELRPPMLDDLGLIPALVWHVAQYREGTGIQVDFKHSGVKGRRFATEIETTAYRIVQEALTNVARHSAAGRVRLEVRIEADVSPGEPGGRDVHADTEWMDIQIEDDGSGFDIDSALAKNRGLGGMRERAQLLGGLFEIESKRGTGTKKRIRLPLREETA